MALPKLSELNWSAFWFGLVGFFGFSLSLFLAIFGQNGSYIFSHVLANACDEDSLTALSGVFAGLTCCLSAPFLMQFVNRLPKLTGKKLLSDEPLYLTWLFGHATWVGFVGLSWVSNHFSVAHKVVSGVAIGASLAFAQLLVLQVFRDYAWRNFRLVLDGAMLLSALGMLVSFPVDCGPDPVAWCNLTFFASQTTYWNFFCFFVFSHVYLKMKTKGD